MVVGVVAASGAAQVPRFNPAHPRSQRLEVWGEAKHTEVTSRHVVGEGPGAIP